MSKLETVYFAVVDMINPLTGEEIFSEKELILDEETYLKYSKFDEDDDIFIHWSEEWEVIKYDENKYLLVNYYDMGNDYHKNEFTVFQTEKIGNLEAYKHSVSIEDLISNNVIG